MSTRTTRTQAKDMEAFPILGDALRGSWIRTVPGPSSSSQASGSVTGSMPTIASGATSPLDHIQAIAQWYAATKESVVQHHSDVPFLTSKGGYNGMAAPRMQATGVRHQHAGNPARWGPMFPERHGAARADEPQRPPATDRGAQRNYRTPSVDVVHEAGRSPLESDTSDTPSLELALFDGRGSGSMGGQLPESTDDATGARPSMVLPRR